MQERFLTRRQVLHGFAGFALEPFAQTLPGYGAGSAIESILLRQLSALNPPSLENTAALGAWFRSIGLPPPNRAAAQIYIDRIHDDEFIQKSLDDLILAEQTVIQVSKEIKGVQPAPVGLTASWIWKENGTKKGPNRFSVNWGNAPDLSAVYVQKNVAQAKLQIGGLQVADLYKLGGPSPWEWWTALHPDASTFEADLNALILESINPDSRWNYQHAPQKGLIDRFLVTRQDGVRIVNPALKVNPNMIAPNLKTFNTNSLSQFITELALKDREMIIAGSQRSIGLLQSEFGKMMKGSSNWGEGYTTTFVHDFANLEYAVLTRREELLDKNG